MTSKLQAPGYPPIEGLLPQEPPMVLLDSVEQHQESTISCLVTAGRVLVPETSTGEIPAWVGLEYMAQSLAALAGLRSLKLGEPPRPGVILGSRRFEASVRAFSHGQLLRVSAKNLSDDDNLAVFDCTISDAKNKTQLVSATLSVYKPKNLLEYYQQKH